MVIPRPILILASASPVRSRLLQAAGIDHDIVPARIDEEAVRDSLRADGATPRDIADALAENKALKVAARNPDRLVLGCDQVLDAGGNLLSKPDTRADAARQLTHLSGTTHQLLSAAVLYHGPEPIWRHVAVARMTMRSLTPEQIEAYLDQAWPDVRGCVGSYQIESLGIRLFSRVEGDHFVIQGLPLRELIGVLTIRKDLPW
jgi:septum formation protein